MKFYVLFCYWSSLWGGETSNNNQDEWLCLNIDMSIDPISLLDILHITINKKTPPTNQKKSILLIPIIFSLLFCVKNIMSSSSNPKEKDESWQDVKQEAPMDPPPPINTTTSVINEDATPMDPPSPINTITSVINEDEAPMDPLLPINTITSVINEDATPTDPLLPMNTLVPVIDHGKLSNTIPVSTEEIIIPDKTSPILETNDSQEKKDEYIKFFNKKVGFLKNLIFTRLGLYCNTMVAYLDQNKTIEDFIKDKFDISVWEALNTEWTQGDLSRALTSLKQESIIEFFNYIYRHMDIDREIINRPLQSILKDLDVPIIFLLDENSSYTYEFLMHDGKRREEDVHICNTKLQNVRNALLKKKSEIKNKETLVLLSPLEKLISHNFEEKIDTSWASLKIPRDALMHLHGLMDLMIKLYIPKVLYEKIGIQPALLLSILFKNILFNEMNGGKTDLPLDTTSNAKNLIINYKFSDEYLWELYRQEGMYKKERYIYELYNSISDNNCLIAAIIGSFVGQYTHIHMTIPPSLRDGVLKQFYEDLWYLNEFMRNYLLQDNTEEEQKINNILRGDTSHTTSNGRNLQKAIEKARKAKAYYKKSIENVSLISPLSQNWTEENFMTFLKHLLDGLIPYIRLRNRDFEDSYQNFSFDAFLEKNNLTLLNHGPNNFLGDILPIRLILKQESYGDHNFNSEILGNLWEYNINSIKDERQFLIGSINSLHFVSYSYFNPHISLLSQKELEDMLLRFQNFFSNSAYGNVFQVAAQGIFFKKIVPN